jgi:hypothetical protein
MKVGTIRLQIGMSREFDHAAVRIIDEGEHKRAG